VVYHILYFKVFLRIVTVQLSKEDYMAINKATFWPMSGQCLVFWPMSLCPATTGLGVCYTYAMGEYLKPLGRPTKYKPEYVNLLIEFFSGEATRKEVMAESSKPNGEVSKTYKYVPNALPTLVGFAKHINVDYHTVWKWSVKEFVEDEFNKMSKANRQAYKNIVEFGHTYKAVKAMQEDFLIQGGLSGAMPASAFIFTAKNITTMRDKVETEVKVTEVRPLLDNVRTKRIDGKDVRVIDIN